MPNPLFQIDEQDVENLNEPQFVDVVNRLIKAEAGRYGIPPFDVKTTLRLNDPDGGIDARVEHSLSLPAICRIPEGVSVWQFKAGDVSPKKISQVESQKPGVQKAIRAGAYYCLLIGKGCSDTERKNRESALNTCFVEQGLKIRAKLFTAQDIADWISDHPPVAMLPYFRRPGNDDLLTFEQWSGLPELRINSVSFEADIRRQQIIDEIGATVSKWSEQTSLRITGRPGVGKTRLTLEAIRATPLATATLYARSIDGVPHNLFSFLENNPRVRMILVVDETTYDDALRLQQLASRCKEKLILITIGHEPIVEGIKTEIPLYPLDKLDDEAITKVVQRAVPSIQPEISSFIVRVSGGYVKLATALADSIVRNPTILSAAELSGIPDVSRILESLVPDPNERKVMEGLSLLTRIGLYDDLATEGKAIAKFMGIDFLAMQRIASQMTRKGLVVKRGRYVYVTPHILAVWFAFNIWRDLSHEIIEKLLLADEGLSPIAIQSLLERLADLGEENVAVPVVEKLLNSEELFDKLEDFNNEFRAKVFSTLAKAAPKPAADAMDRVLGHLPRDQLLFLTTGRRQVVWTLENFLMREETFWVAARLLLKLAEAENESYGNNATGVWNKIFLTHLSSTPIPATDRHRLIQEAIESNSVVTRILGVKAIGTALSTYEVGVGSSGFGGYIPSQPWRPKTWGDIWDTRRSALRLLDKALTDPSDEVVKIARGILLNTSESLIKQGLFDDVIPRLQKFPTKTEQEKKELWELCKRILHFGGNSLSEEQSITLQQIAESLLGNNFRDRLHRWAGRVSPVDRIELQDQSKQPEEMAISLAEEGYANPDLLQPELNWLGSKEAEQGYSFAKRLGELDTDHVWLEKLIKVIIGGGNPNLLSTYLIGRASAGDQEWVNKIMDTWIESEKTMADVVYETIRLMDASDDGAAKIINLIDKGWLSISRLGWLGWGKWVESLSQNKIDEFLNRLEKYDDPISTEIAFVLLVNWLKHNNSSIRAMLGHASKLLVRSSAINNQTMLQYYWEQLAELFMEELAVEIAQAILQTLLESEHIFIVDDARMNILRMALSRQPKTIWPLIGNILLRKDMKGYDLRLEMRNWGIENAGITTLIEWANANKPLGPCILAEVAVPFSDLAYQLLIEFGEEGCIGSGLISNFLSGSFSGSEVQWLKSKLEIAQKWVGNDQPAVMKWVQELIKNIEVNIKRAQQQEEENELYWG